MIDEKEKSPIESLSKTVNAVGMKMDKKEINRRYFGKTPKGTYFGKPKNLATMHDLTMSENRKRELYGIGQKTDVPSTGELVNTRLATDSKADLIRELVENSNMDRRTAEAVVVEWMSHNHLVEKQTAFGKAIISEGE